VKPAAQPSDRFDQPGAAKPANSLRAELLCHSLAVAAAEKSVFMLANSCLPRRVDGQVDGAL
jgi:hypothetical protein